MRTNTLNLANCAKYGEDALIINENGGIYLGNNTENPLLIANIQPSINIEGQDISLILSTVYPIGSIYMSVNNTSPQILFGFGNWEKIEDKFLLASGNNYVNGSEGGEESHILTVDEMPTHSHNFNRHQLWRTEDVPIVDTEDGYGANNKTLTVYSDLTTSVGGNMAHNNMPPYLVVNVWKRVG